jgi:hypothetical protein
MYRYGLILFFAGSAANSSMTYMAPLLFNSLGIWLLYQGMKLLTPITCSISTRQFGLPFESTRILAIDLCLGE